MGREKKHFKIIIALIHYSPLIQPRLTWPKWNMGEIVGMKFHLPHLHTCLKPHTEFVILCQNPPFYEVKLIRRKWLAHGGISKIFFRDHFSLSFLGQKW